MHTYSTRIAASGVACSNLDSDSLYQNACMQCHGDDSSSLYDLLTVEWMCPPSSGAIGVLIATFSSCIPRITLHCQEFRGALCDSDPGAA